MGKRKVEDDDDYAWDNVQKQAYPVPTSKPAAGPTAATRVKNEPLDAYNLVSSLPPVAGPSHSSPKASVVQSSAYAGAPVPTAPRKPSKRVKKEVDAGEPVEKRLARVRKSCPKVSQLQYTC